LTKISTVHKTLHTESG